MKTSASFRSHRDQKQPPSSILTGRIEPPWIERLEERIVMAITLGGVPTWVEQGAGPGTADGAVEVPGDDEISGAIQAIAVNPFDATEVIVGATTGGVWKTNNLDPLNPAAVTWTPISDDLGALNIGAVAYDPADATGNTIYAGTGYFSNAFFLGASSPSIGLYKSTDGGDNWTLQDTTTLSGHRIHNILANGNVVLVAAIDGTGIPLGESRSWDSLGGGLFRSDDGGGTFTQEVAGNGGLPNGAVTGLIVDPQTATTVYAAVVGGAAPGVYQSTDGGDTWTPVNMGLTNLAGSTDIELAVQRVAGVTTLFATVATGNTLNGVFSSTNPGAGWAALAGALPAITAGASFNEKMQIVADPANANVVYIAGQGGGTHIFRYDPGAMNWVAINGTGNALNNTSPHPDPRDMQFVGTNAILEADDGGLYVLPTPTNANAVGWDFIGGQTAAVEFFSVAYDSTNDILFGGTQDNGSQHQSAPGSFSWTGLLGGDGQTAQVDTTSAGGGDVLRYSLSNNFQNFERNRFDNANAFVSAAQVQLRNAPAAANFSGLNAADQAVNFFDFIPYTLNTVDPRLMMIGYNGVYQDTDNTGLAGDVITDITANVGALNNVASALAYGGRRAGADQVDVAFVGTRGGQLFFRGETGAAFTNVSDGGAGEIGGGGSVVDSITVDPQDWRQVYVVKGGQIWFSPNVTALGTAGNEFRIIGGGLNDNLDAITSQIRTATLLDTTPGTAGDSTLLVGGLGGAFRLKLEMGTLEWSEFGLGLPGTVVRDLRYDATDDLLVAGTFGRGAWTLANASGNINNVGILQITGDDMFPGQDDIIRLIRNQANPENLEVYLNSATPTGVFPISAIQQINVNSLGGNDTLIYDSTNGLIAVPDGTRYDGGTQSDSLQLLQTGGTQVTDEYSIGPNNGDGSSVISGATGIQSVAFQNIEPVLDLVPAPALVVNGTPAANAIGYTLGNLLTTGLVTIDNFEGIEFSNKITLTLNGFGGSDEISIHNDSAPTALTGITVNGGDPTGSDRLIFSGTAGADAFTLTATSLTAGTVTGVVLPLDYTGVESLTLDGGDGGDTFNLDAATGAVTLHGGAGVDVASFAAAAAGVVFDLDAVNVAQRVSTSDALVILADRFENFVGSTLEDILTIHASTFLRDVNGGTPSLAPGDRLIIDGQGAVVALQKTDLNTGTVKIKGFADVTFDEFESFTVVNSPGGGGFGAPGASNAFTAGEIYDLTQILPLPARPLVGLGPTAVAVGDVDGDGIPDLVSANSKSKFLSILLGKGDGTFGLATNILSGGTKPTDLALADLEADGDLDIVVTNSGSKTVALLLNNGAGVFGAPVLTPKLKLAPTALAVGDLDGDARPDVVVAHTGGAVSVFLGVPNGVGGALGPQAQVATGGKGTADVALGDFTGDGLLDIVTANGATRNVSLLANAGAGVFSIAPQLFASGIRPTALAVADFNNDGKQDIAVSHAVSRFVSIFIGNATPVASLQAALHANYPGSHFPKTIAAGDFNADGKVDLALGPTVAGRLRVILGGGQGDFSQPFEFDLGNKAARVVGGLTLADVNGDGQLDIVTANTSSNDLSVLLRNA